MSEAVHRYRCGLRWEGSTGVGYDHYHRVHRWWVEADGGTRVTPTDELSNDPAFGGNPAYANPEHLLLMAASSCQLFSFLAVAARARIDVVGYADDATAEMPEADEPLRITTITLRPRITIRTDDPARPTDDRLSHLVDVAHRECFIANSVHPEITIDPTFART